MFTFTSLETCKRIHIVPYIFCLISVRSHRRIHSIS